MLIFLLLLSRSFFRHKKVGIHIEYYEERDFAKKSEVEYVIVGDKNYDYSFSNNFNLVSRIFISSLVYEK